VSERLAGADGRTHGTLAVRGPVVAHVAFHHLLVFRKNLGNSEGTSEDAVRTADAARLQGRLHNAVLALFDGLGRTNHPDGGLVTMPADVSGGGGGSAAIEEVEIDHRIAAVRFTLFASFDARLAANTPRWIHVELVTVHQCVLRGEPSARENAQSG